MKFELSIKCFKYLIKLNIFFKIQKHVCALCSELKPDAVSDLRVINQSTIISFSLSCRCVVACLCVSVSLYQSEAAGNYHAGH